MKIELLLFLSVATPFVLASVLVQVLVSLMNAWEMHIYRRLDTLKRRWTRARRLRTCWLKRYGKILLDAVSHPEYMRLWNCEIGAEALYNIELDSSLEISYDDFKAEQQAL